MASRNANRAASSRDSPANSVRHYRHPVPADAGQQGENLHRADERRLAGTDRRQPPVGFPPFGHFLAPDGRVARGVPRRSRVRAAERELALGGEAPVGRAGRAPEPLPSEQDQAVDGQEHRGVDRLAEDHPERVLEGQSRDADRDGGQDDHPGQLLVDRQPLPAAGPVRGPDQMPERGEEPRDDPDPVSPEIDQQRDRGGHVQADDEGQVRRLGRGHVQILRPAAADQGREQHVVPEAGHREQFGDALDQADHGGLQVSQVSHAKPFTLRGMSSGHRYRPCQRTGPRAASPALASHVAPPALA